ncbi:MAG: type II toxin-antitoxin system RelE family toxin [Allosphingosinicella sp.]|uniref:type II toxin-antitoxin system RelE family toxin n=1 Tax=Allosphingosinicella sp. TaxID=2823234 RepID=UPI003921E08D
MRSAWTIEFTPKALKQLRKLPSNISHRIVATLERAIQGHDPRDTGEAMIGNWTGYWRYRVGDYRAVCRIEDAVVTVFVIEVGHRREVYR